VFGYINLTRAILREMKQRRAGVIINVIGYAGERLSARYIIGSTGNAGLMAFSRAVGSQSPDFGVRVVAVNPGYTSTDRAQSMLRTIAESKLGSAERWRDVERELNLPFGRMGTPREVADVVTFLASPRSSYVSGTVVTVDGGATNRNM
jgi:NAD(P)-dependent dehydrogenase (short-subunit alcohol dehydrogenase family)